MPQWLSIMSCSCSIPTRHSLNYYCCCYCILWKNYTIFCVLVCFFHWIHFYSLWFFSTRFTTHTFWLFYYYYGSMLDTFSWRQLTSSNKKGCWVHQFVSNVSNVENWNKRFDWCLTAPFKNKTIKKMRLNSHGMFLKEFLCASKVKSAHTFPSSFMSEYSKSIRQKFSIQNWMFVYFHTPWQ